MPIRTPRGRSAAYRALWQWPLRSPARLGLCVVLVLAAAVRGRRGHPVAAGRRAVGTVAAPGASASVPSEDAPPESPASIVPTVLPPVAALTPSSVPLSAAPSTALSVAGRWAAAWVDHPPGVHRRR